MSMSLILGCVWVLAATATAFLPMRRQYPPGIALLIAAPPLLGYIGWQHGFWIAVLAVLGFASMFRNPLIYLVRKAMGKPAPRPEEG
ncbi:MAG: DUF2484 family protein [Paracoccaceae bacterium]